MMTCPSVNTIYHGGNRLSRHPCVHDDGHTGHCHDGQGHTWTRLGELLRQSNLRLNGMTLDEVVP